MIVLIAKSVVPQKNKEAFLQVAEKLVSETRKEAGCIFYDFVKDSNEENVYYFVEKYTDQEAVEAHKNSEHFVTYAPKMRALREDAQLIQCDVLTFE
ncbi:putative monooxygenase YcnE [Anaerotignum neopropionicum]|uniref:Putative monooxygenase YcnE n=1 Tax=Anaerotignum neopropionicum TaxID=36847 RepID=A0A136WDX8_9FIRM|nr:putative quinol monooxygenase [Anaerotignum neopropionicum]KXL52727.1 putative monooxygenase YcnE [Anaerotignum neopropionicum]